jgi:hypothetical protein
MNTSENDPAEGSSEASNKEEEKKESESITEAPEAVGSDDDSEKLVSSDGPEPDMDLEGNSREHDINKRVKVSISSLATVRPVLIAIHGLPSFIDWRIPPGRTREQGS